MSKNMSTQQNTKNMVRKRPPKRHPGEAPKNGSKMDPEGDPEGTFSRDRCVACLERSRQLVAQSIMRRTSTGLGPMAMPMFTQSHRPEMIFGSSPQPSRENTLCGRNPPTDSQSHRLGTSLDYNAVWPWGAPPQDPFLLDF